MKKLFSTILVALVATVASYAQTIAVVSPSGSTTMYQDLGKAVTEAEDGSVIYLPGGGFQLNDSIHIKHKVTIMGVSHRADTDNAEGATIVSGNINLDKEASGSAFMGFYLSGDLVVGNETDGVENITVRKCNFRSIQVKNANSSGMIVNQNYLRSRCDFGKCNVRLENNILQVACNIQGGIVNHNVIKGMEVFYYYYDNFVYALYEVANSIISNNFFLREFTPSYGTRYSYSFHSGADCQIYNNCRGTDSWGENCLVLPEGTSWEDVFVDPTHGVNISSDFHLKGTWGKGDDASDGTQIGIYGGNGNTEQDNFDDDALAPIPRIISKEIPEQTDASGKLNIKITVKAK